MIDDKIDEHGSKEAYLEYLKSNIKEPELKTVEQLLVEHMDELHYQKYPSTDKVPIYKIESVQGDYFPLHMVKTVAERYAAQSKK